MKNDELEVRLKREQLEADKLTRRAALRKMGLTTGFALFGMFAVDDLARMTMTRLKQMHLHNEVVSTVAKEFKNVGVAFANPPHSSSKCHECVNGKRNALANNETLYEACGDAALAQYRDPNDGSYLDEKILQERHDLCKATLDYQDNVAEQRYHDCCVANNCNC